MSYGRISNNNETWSQRMLVHSDEFPLDYGLICDWSSYGYVFDGSPEKKHWWWTQWLWKGNLGLLCSVLLLKVQEEGAQRDRGWKNEIYLFLEGEKICILNIIVKQILRLMIKNRVFWVSLVWITMRGIVAKEF